MANERRLIVADYDAVRAAFDNEFRATSKLIHKGFRWEFDGERRCE